MTQGLRGAIVTSVLLLAASRGAGGQQPPRFQSSVDVTSVDVSVVDDNGRPVQNLAPSDFAVRVDGNARRVVAAEWVSLVTAARAPAVVPIPPGYSSNENSTGGRLIVIAVDQPNIRFGGARAVMTAVTAFIDRLSPSDRIAAVGFGPGSPATTFTADRERVKQAVARMVGQRQSSFGAMHEIALSEALAIVRGDPIMLTTVMSRECQQQTAARTPGPVEMC